MLMPQRIKPTVNSVEYVRLVHRVVHELWKGEVLTSSQDDSWICQP